MKMNDERGCSLCKPGEERYESFTSDRGQMVHYDYRTPAPDGQLFSCCTRTLIEAQARRDKWVNDALAKAADRKPRGGGR